jgi:hypothetical protein
MTSLTGEISIGNARRRHLYLALDDRAGDIGDTPLGLRLIESGPA